MNSLHEIQLLNGRGVCYLEILVSFANRYHSSSKLLIFVAYYTDNRLLLRSALHFVGCQEREAKLQNQIKVSEAEKGMVEEQLKDRDAM